MDQDVVYTHTHTHTHTHTEEEAICLRSGSLDTEPEMGILVKGFIGVGAPRRKLRG